MTFSAGFLNKYFHIISYTHTNINPLSLDVRVGLSLIAINVLLKLYLNMFLLMILVGCGFSLSSSKFSIAGDYSGEFKFQVALELVSCILLTIN